MNEQQAQAIEREADNIPLKIGFKRLSENAVIPTKAHVSDSGYDLYAAQDVVIAPGETVVIPTDIAVVLPENHEGVVRPRSGITSRTSLRIQLGSIDNSYRGNIGIIVDNISAFDHDLEPFYTDISVDSVGFANMNYEIKRGDKIAQLVVQQLPQTIAVEITDELDSTERGGRGFGSSGV